MARAINYKKIDFVYTLLSSGFHQRQIPKYAKRKGINLSKSMVSRYTKRLMDDEYIKCTQRGNLFYYAATKKPYPFYSRELHNEQGGCELRVHSITAKYDVLVFPQKMNVGHKTVDMKWDKIIPLRNGVKKYIYHGYEDDTYRDVTVEFIGKYKFTMFIYVGSIIWHFNNIVPPKDFLDDADDFIKEKFNGLERAIHYKLHSRFKRISFRKKHYALVPPPEQALIEAAKKDNYAVGELNLDSSLGFHEIEGIGEPGKKKVIKILDLYNNLPTIAPQMQKFVDMIPQLQELVKLLPQLYELADLVPQLQPLADIAKSFDMAKQKDLERDKQDRSFA